MNAGGAANEPFGREALPIRALQRGIRPSGVLSSQGSCMRNVALATSTVTDTMSVSTLRDGYPAWANHPRIVGLSHG